MIKGDFHLHSDLDSLDFLFFSPKDAIDKAARLGFQALAFTYHEELKFPKSVQRYASRKGICLLPGIEFHLENIHILALNVTAQDVKKVKNLQDLKKIHRKDTLIIVPHVFFPWAHGVGKRITEILDFVDALEYHSFYVKFFNPFNKKMVRFAKEQKKPIIGGTDLHMLSHFGKTYTLLDIKGKVTPQKIIRAVKEGKVTYATRPLPLWQFMQVFFYFLCPDAIKRLLNNIFY